MVGLDAMVAVDGVVIVGVGVVILGRQLLCLVGVGVVTLGRQLWRVAD